MTNYVKRRKRWWSLFKNLDNSVELSTKILGDLCLEASGLSNDQQLMILTSTGNNDDFDAIAKALVDQHPKIQMSERPRNDGHKKDLKGKGRSQDRGSRPRAKPWNYARQSHMAMD